jgi:UDP-N-acetylmuramoylalanine--D-glutamate ligase
MAERALVLGMGVSGEAVARHLRDRGAVVVAVDDAPGPAARERAGAAGVELVERPDQARLAALVAEAAVVVPSPGVPERHPAITLAAAAGVPVRSEVELASRWARRPMVAITGTNGKTTVTGLVAAMLEASGRRAVAAGNIGLPLSDAVRRDVDVVVAEVSSFQLRFTDTFRPAVAVWLNLAEDHLDWHGTVEAYAAAKARIWAHQGPADMAVVNADDPLVTAAARSAPSTVVTFGLDRADADYRVEEGALVGPRGSLVAVADLPRALPHDLANGLAAAAAALAAGATPAGVADALRRSHLPGHRLDLVAEAGGIRWYDDSKATNPHAALAALRAFDSVVLVAGGRNKGLDLGVLAAAADRVRAVVAIGEAAPEVERAFAGVRPVTVAGSMDEAVRAAAAAARGGDAVVLAPGCASFDWYRSYAERGDDFVRAVTELVGA